MSQLNFINLFLQIFYQKYDHKEQIIQFISKDLLNLTFIVMT
jgi:hypothetical protein